jgi:hypothetical protein
MALLKQKDIQDLLRLFDYELNTLPRMSKIEKMKIRKKVVNAISTASSLNIKKPDLFMSTLEGKLYTVFDIFIDSWGFREKLERKIKEIIHKNIDQPAEDQ